MGIRNKISPGYVYYCTLTIVEWIDIFSRPAYKHLIVDSLNYCIANKGLKVYCWCLMSNHLHIIASATDEDSLRAFRLGIFNPVINYFPYFFIHDLG